MNRRVLPGLLALMVLTGCGMQVVGGNERALTRVDALATNTEPAIGKLAEAALAPHPALTILRRDGVVFRPLAGSRRGLIFYPGGKVAPEAYAPLARAWALAGYTVCIPSMPRQLALFAPNQANVVMKQYADVDRWVIGGHSLGGVAASIYAAWNTRRIAGLFLLAALPGPTVNLSRTALPVLSIYGSEDRRVTLEEVNAEMHRLPKQTQRTGIDGANHAQFGDYGPHPNDGVASISRQRQHELVISLTLDWLKQVLDQ